MVSFPKDGHIYYKLQGVDDCSEMRMLLEEYTGIVCELGYTKPLANAILADKDEILRTVFLHQTIFR